MDIFGDEFIVPTSETNPVPLNAQSGASSSGLDFMSIDGTSSLGKDKKIHKSINLSQKQFL